MRAALGSSRADSGVVVDRDAERRQKLTLISSGAFAESTYPMTWLVNRVLVKGQPAIFGGPRKSLKTNTLVDLVVSLGAAGTAPKPSSPNKKKTSGKRQPPPHGAIKFLGHFPVPARMRVGFFSGESGPATLQETARRVCAAKGVRLADSGVLWGFHLPQLAARGDLDVLGALIADNALEVVVIDPAYLALLAGNTDLQASNLYHMGPLLSEFSQVCLEAGATPILVHHARKQRETHARYGPLELEELAFAGVQEFARQWCLISRRAQYDPGTGAHRLWLNVGGSAGFSGLWGVDINEGLVDDMFRGRKWDVRVLTVQEIAQAEAAEREAKKSSAKAVAVAQLRARVSAHLNRPENRHGDSLTGIAQGIGKSKARDVEALVAQMVQADELVRVAKLKKGKRTTVGYRLSDDD